MAAAELRRIAPHAGSYVSESKYFNRDWQEEYWGENYARLRAMKSAYDPDGPFCVHHAVGSEDWSADGFTACDEAWPLKERSRAAGIKPAASRFRRREAS